MYDYLFLLLFPALFLSEVLLLRSFPGKVAALALLPLRGRRLSFSSPRRNPAPVAIGGYRDIEVGGLVGPASSSPRERVVGWSRLRFLRDNVVVAIGADDPLTAPHDGGYALSQPLVRARAWRTGGCVELRARYYPTGALPMFVVFAALAARVAMPMLVVVGVAIAALVAWMQAPHARGHFAAIELELVPRLDGLWVGTDRPRFEAWRRANLEKLVMGTGGGFLLLALLTGGVGLATGSTVVERVAAYFLGVGVAVSALPLVVVVGVLVFETVVLVVRTGRW